MRLIASDIRDTHLCVVANSGGMMRVFQKIATAGWTVPIRIPSPNTDSVLFPESKLLPNQKLDLMSFPSG